ncbi:MAG: glycosyltransferase family 2 protein, partial [Leptospiraceae bacterium]|nr:glycosyltransferase family 2 protein [Leptospiraceae bacterium]
GEFILSLDSDERVSENLNLEIQKLLKEDFLKDGYKIPRLTFHLGKFIRHSGWYPLKRFRFFRKGHGKWTGENPHDFIEIVGSESELKGDIIHYSFTDLSHQVDTINKFSSIVAFTRFQKMQKFSYSKCVWKPIVKFFEIYFYKLGFLDGFAGFTIAISSAYSTFLKQAKIFELEKNGLKRPSNLRADYGN